MTQRLSDSFLEKWEHIIRGVESTSVPLGCIAKLVIRLEGRKQRTINLGALRKKGLDDEDLEAFVNKRLDELSESITSVDFEVDIQSVAERVQPETDKLLKKL